MNTYESIYNKMCRICCKPSDHKMLPLLDSTADDGLSLYGKGVQTFANITIKTAIPIPASMCQYCFYLLKNAITFKIKCEENDKKVQQIIQNKQNLMFEDFNECFVKHTLFNSNVFNEESKSVFINIEPIAKSEVNNYESEESKLLIDDDFNSDEISEEELMINSEEPFSDMNDDNDTNEGDGNSNGDSNNLDEEEKVDKYLDILLDVTGRSLKLLKKENQGVFKKIPFEFKRKPKRKQKKTKIVTTGTGLGLQCNVCNKVLATRSSLNYHQQKHFGYKYICELCGKAYPNNAELGVHQANRHGIGKILSCQYCTFKTGRELDLREHIRLHTGERPFTCDKCGLTFRRKYLYTRHLVHHTEKTVQCPHCPKKFFHKTHMQAHCNTNHFRRYFYSCVRCGVKYTQSKTLRRHLSKNSKCAEAYEGHTSRSLLRREDYIVTPPPSKMV